MLHPRQTILVTYAYVEALRTEVFCRTFYLAGRSKTQVDPGRLLRMPPRGFSESFVEQFSVSPESWFDCLSILPVLRTR